MAVDMDQQQTFKHFCRICKKGFGCGRALGGHMRAHGIGDDDYPTGDWDDKLGGNASAGNKRMYALRTNPNRLKSCRSCENCGQEFASWKSFFEHGKCTSDDDAVSSSPGREEDNGGWSKGKRTRRVKVGYSNSSEEEEDDEEEDLANCLVMLSTARVDPLVAETEESCASASKEEGRKRKEVRKGLFECKACKKMFHSHQALGGHRASHKKVKGCFASKLEESMVEEDVITLDNFSIPSSSKSLPSPPLDLDAKRKSKVHECSICHRIFASGQALGGHKRCHWVTSNSSETCSVPKHQDHSQLMLQQRPNFSKSEPLDLNLPAPVDDQNPLHMRLSSSIYLQQWIGGVHANNTNKENSSSSLHLDEESDSKIKLAKLSDLKDMNLGGDSSPWLQVGIGSAANGTGEP